MIITTRWLLLRNTKCVYSTTLMALCFRTNTENGYQSSMRLKKENGQSKIMVSDWISIILEPNTHTLCLKANDFHVWCLLLFNLFTKRLSTDVIHKCYFKLFKTTIIITQNNSHRINLIHSSFTSSVSVVVVSHTASTSKNTHTESKHKELYHVFPNQHPLFSFTLFWYFVTQTYTPLLSRRAAIYNKQVCCFLLSFIFKNKNNVFIVFVFEIVSLSLKKDIVSVMFGADNVKDHTEVIWQNIRHSFSNMYMYNVFVKNVRHNGAKFFVFSQ